MSTIPSPQTTTISTFSSPRTAPRPRVIPLFLTPVQQRRQARTPAIHENLRSKPIYHPYPQTKRPITPIVPQAASSSSPSSGDGSAFSSPLTSVEEEFPSDTEILQATSQPILIPPPQGSLTVASLNVHTATAKEYRAFAKAAIIAFKLNINRPLSEQDLKSRDDARTRIESNIPHFQGHEDHWGADILLRDQLKSMRDTNNKRKKKDGDA